MLDNIYETIQKDELYQSLIAVPPAAATDAPSPDSGSSRHKPTVTMGAASLPSIADQIKHLTAGLDRVTGELQSQVRQQHGALLSQASHAGKLSVALDAVCGHMERLQAGADRLRAHIHQPFDACQQQTRVLARLHDASHLLRQAGRFLQLARQLQTAQAQRDAAAQARLLHELEPLTSDAALAAVELIRDERAQVLLARQRMNTKTGADLVQALRAGNEPLVVRSLQIVGHLQTLDASVVGLLAAFEADIRQAIQECFAGTAVAAASDGSSRLSGASAAAAATSTAEVPAPVKRGPGKTPTLVTSQHFRSKLWSSITWLFDDEIHGYCAQVVLLQHCLQQVSGGSSGVADTGDVEQRFWLALEQLLTRSFDECAIHVRQCLQQDLPKLLAAARSLQARFGTKFAFGADVFRPLEAGYLEQCAVHLKAPLLGVDSPDTATADAMVRAAAAQLSAALVDGRLCLLVANVYNACGGEFVSRCGGLVKLGTDAQQVIDIPNGAQLQNIQLANTLHYYAGQVRRCVQQLGAQFAASAAGELLLHDLGKGERLVGSIVQQLFESMQKAINIILLSMHREPGLTGDRTAGNGGQQLLPQSLYMKELQEFVQRSWTLHIVPFHDRDTVAQSGKALAERCIELFIHNVITIRPLSSSGRQKLQADAHHLEAALRPIVADISSFGRPYRQLRAVASLIVMTADELASQPVQLDGPLQPFAVLLMQFGYAAAELHSPHTAAGWSNEKLLEWLAGHTSDRERMDLISGALVKYRTTVRQRNIVQYDPVYPGIAACFERVSLAMLESATTSSK